MIELPEEERPISGVEHWAADLVAEAHQVLGHAS